MLGQKYKFLCCPFKEMVIHRKLGIALSVRLSVGPSVTKTNCWLYNVTLPFTNIFFIKHSNDIAYDEMDMKMPNYLGQGHVCWNLLVRHNCSTEHPSVYRNLLKSLFYEI